jgi:hypothetical protein
VEKGCFKSRDKTERVVKLCYPALAGKGIAVTAHCIVVLKPFSAALPGPRAGKNLVEERAWLIADAKQESTHLGVFYERSFTHCHHRNFASYLWRLQSIFSSGIWGLVSQLERSC